MPSSFFRFTGPAALVATSVLPFAAVACASKPANDPNGYNANAGYNPQQGAYANGAPPPGYATGAAPYPGQQPVQPYPGAAQPQQPYPGAPPQAYPPPGQQPPPGGAPAQPPQNSLAQSALDLVIQATSKVDAPGMDAEGPAITGTVTEGGHVDGLVNLAPGKCYTVIAAGAVNVLTKIDVTLYAPPLFNVPAGSDSGGINAPAVIGKGSKALCPAIMFQLAYKVEVTGKKGSGDVRAQLFSKAKK